MPVHRYDLEFRPPVVFPSLEDNFGVRSNPKTLNFGGSGTLLLLTPGGPRRFGGRLFDGSHGDRQGNEETIFSQQSSSELPEPAAAPEPTLRRRHRRHRQQEPTIFDVSEEDF